MASPDPFRAWLRAVVVHAAQAGWSPATTVAVLGRDLARQRGAPSELVDALAAAGGPPTGPPTGVPVPPSRRAAPGGGVAHTGSDPVLSVGTILGSAYEALLGAPQRRRGGVFYTPAGVTRRLVAIGLDALAPGSGAPLAAGTTLRDPTVGAGAFLLAGADELVARGADPLVVVRDRLHGRDIDAAAVAIARTVLAWWAWERTGEVVWPGDGLTVGDSLADGPPERSVPTLVVGNPPFLNQLQRQTARSAEHRRRFEERFGAAARGYVDTAALFLLAAVETAAPGDVIVLVQPESVLGAAHTESARRWVADRADLVGLWAGGGGLFAAGVRVCAPVLRRRDPSRPAGAGLPAVSLWSGGEVRRKSALVPAGAVAGASHGSWSPLLGAARGVPAVTLVGEGTLAELASATAGFRDQFYGLVPYVTESGEEGPDWAPLVTAGLLAPDECRWGQVPARFARRDFVHPVVDLDAVRRDGGSLARWVQARRVPKVLVAPQSAVVAAAVDVAGWWIPSVPVVSVEPHDPSMLWAVAALLLAPVVTAHAATLHGGLGLSATALRLSARQLRALPLPVDRVAWQEAAAVLAARPSPRVSEPRQDRLCEAGGLMADAYRISPSVSAHVEQWWIDRYKGMTARYPSVAVL